MYANVAKLLAKQRTGIDLKNTYSFAVLHMTDDQNKRQTVEVLLENGSDVDIATNDHCKFLMTVALKIHPDDAT